MQQSIGRAMTKTRTEYESNSNLRETFSHIIDTALTKIGTSNILKASWLDTPLGPMLAIGDDKALYLLEFLDRKGLERKVERLRKKIQSAIIPGHTPPIISIENELKKYFEGKLIEFTTPLFFLGSPFQQRVWDELQKIPFGETRSYSEIATAINQPSAFRAVANANGANPCTLIVPCHRVINTSGALGGYSAGLTRKKWLLNHEKTKM